LGDHRVLAHWWGNCWELVLVTLRVRVTVEKWVLGLVKWLAHRWECWMATVLVK
jgi:hypothetical protein